MTVKQLADKLELSCATLPCPEKEIDGVYIGDLLSWVMGRAEVGNVWITIMSNINVIAVATLADLACVILAEGVTLDEKTLETAAEKSVNILLTKLSAYEIAVRLHDLL